MESKEKCREMATMEENQNNCDTEHDGEASTMEYVIFHDTTESGREVEMAVIEEFEYENKYYVVSAQVKDDTVYDEDLFIYRLLLKGKDDYSVEKIADPKEYEKVAKAYIEM